jgi:hypothetical protein
VTFNGRQKLFLSLSESTFTLPVTLSFSLRFFPFYPKFPHLETHDNEYVYDISRIVDGLLVWCVSFERE